MPKPQLPVELGNSLSLREYIERFLPEVSKGLKFESPKLAKPYVITLELSSSISPADLEDCYKLLTETSKADYETAAMGWHPRKKLREMRLPDLRYLMVKPEPDAPLEGFASFMLTYEDGNEVVYLYEVHLQESLRGTGLGKKLMSLVESAGRSAGMSKAMLTVFRNNTSARAFYEALRYAVDEYSPEPKVLRGGVIKQPDYDILFKSLR
jgi:ribosomal protein S18 acetylase RimI-like enzyme